MPFTLAHPAAVLPLMRRPFVAPALVCGAVAADIPYYLRATPIPVTAQSWYEPFLNATTSHSVNGLFFVTLPLALISYLMALAATPPARWLVHRHWDVRAVRAASTPDSSGRVPRRDRTRWVWALVSLALGALTHLVWDSFTDDAGFLVERLDGLHEPVLADLTWGRLLQHASTIIGLTILGVALWRRRRAWLGDDAVSRRRTSRALLVLAAVGLLAGSVSVLLTVDASASPSSRDLVENILSTAAMSGGAAIGVALILATVWWWLAVYRPTRRP